MNKSDAIRAMLDGDTTTDDHFLYTFDGDTFMKSSGDGHWFIYDINLDSADTVWSIYTPPKKTEKRWKWLVKPGSVIMETSQYYANKYLAEEDLYNGTILKPLDGTNGTWYSEITVEVD